jgi:hypothetical protein
LAIPTQPTASLITTEAYKLFGISNPTTAQLTRATDYGLEMVKSDLRAMGLEWDFLRTTTWLPMTVGVSYVQLPTDYAKFLSARVLDGVRGTAQSYSAPTLTLAASDPSGSDVAGKWVVITSATAGSGQAKQIKSYNTSTKEATLESSFDTAPTGTIVYLIADSHLELDYRPVFDYNQLTQPGLPGKPVMCSIKSDSAEGDLYADKSADKVYAIELEYYADINKIDLTATLYSRILRLLNQLFIQGVFVWLLQDDARVELETQRYEKLKARFSAMYLYPNNIQNLQMHLDY